MRGYGIPQAMFAMESHTEDVARAIGMDPYEFRMKNVMPKGFTDGFSKNVNYYDSFRECMEKGRKEFDYDRRKEKYAVRPAISGAAWEWRSSGTIRECGRSPLRHRLSHGAQSGREHSGTGGRD